MIAKLVIRLIRTTAEVLSPHHSDRDYHLDGDHTFEQHIDPILELKSPSRVKPKGKPPGAKNKKRSQTETGLDYSTRREPSRFEYEERKDKSKNTSVKNSDLSKRQRKAYGRKHILIVVKVKRGKR